MESLFTDSWFLKIHQYTAIFAYALWLGFAIYLAITVYRKRA
jgi:hypothetical protein